MSFIDKIKKFFSTEEKELSPSDYFNQVKEKQMKSTDESLNKIYKNTMHLINKYDTTGQTKALAKLFFVLETIEREHELLKKGIDTYIHEQHITKYIEEVAAKTVKIIELSEYPREVPDDIVEKISQTKDIFDEFYVVFTDYTGEIEREVAQEKRDRDPILFGVFKDDETRTLIDRFYFLGDWEDEYCDLTLEKMVAEMRLEGTEIENRFKTPEDIEELKERIQKERAL